MMVNWCDWHHSEVSAPVLYQLLSLRSAVFVLEQQCLYADMDGLDMQGDNRHIAGFDESGLVACARLLVQRDAVSIGRVVIAPRARGLGLGGRLMHQALASCAARWPEKPVTLSAQAHLQAFYRALGFAAVTDIYDEDGIPHIGMRRPSPYTLKE
ncbi:Putative GCN5-related N-acetyltransferase [Sodalis praecaptivus]|uniref:Protein ElaA n=2 Tax=Bruguierivoracaceae TaxID=2812006 RepID=W0I2M9_9GAMM|nr:Putative GCN5-related N-acetyltransferase [Sodalis praecaptivus]